MKNILTDEKENHILLGRPCQNECWLYKDLGGQLGNQEV